VISKLLPQRCQLEHEVPRKALRVALDLLNEHPGFHAIEIREIFIEHSWHPRTTKILFSIAGATISSSDTVSSAESRIQAECQVHRMLLSTKIGLTGRYLNRLDNLSEAVRREPAVPSARSPPPPHPA